MTSFKMLCFSLISLVVVTHFFLHKFFPYADADPAMIDPERALLGVEQNTRKLKVLH